MSSQISTDELNLLVYRYLVEAGYSHTSFVFSTESQLALQPSATAEVPFGALVSILHKGLLFERLEHEVSQEPTNHKRSRATTTTTTTTEDKDSTELTVLKGHKSDVFVCAFNPKHADLLASGSGDACARVWNLANNKQEIFECGRVLEHIKAPSSTAGAAEESVDITTVSWSPDGALLATGSLDGRVRLWNCQGEFVAALISTNSSIFSVKWSATGDYILTGGQDQTAVIWDVKERKIVQSTKLHTQQTLDVDWRPCTTTGGSGFSFASCSSDKTICIVDGALPPILLVGHQDEVNSIKWSHDGTLLVSCSDDHTAKVWRKKSESSPEWTFVDLRGHSKEVYTVKWAPTGPKSPNEHISHRRVATGSLDCTVRVWDADTGAELYCLNKQVDAVYAVEYDPTGAMLLSGSFDGLVNVWQSDTGTLLKSVKVGAGVFDVSWNIRGDKFAAATADGNITICDF